jgi:3-oxoacyl-[acyl-carrier protein] reductase
LVERKVPIRVDLDLGGRRVLVTGASRGIGRAIVELFLAEGARVAGCARNVDDFDRASPAIGHDRLHCSAVDVADADALVAWVDQAAAWLEGLDIVVHCAAAHVPGSSERAFRANLDTDVLGLARLAKATEAQLAESGVGSLTTIGTTSAVEQFGRVSAYSALKSAAIHYVAGLAQAWAPLRIRANSVSPGPVFIEGGSWDTIRTDAPELFESTLAACPFGRMGTAQEVARVVAFVASPAASWVTGENVVVDGAFTRRIAY